MEKKSLPFVSVVLPTYNSSYFIQKCLESLVKTNYPKFEIIIVDDYSSDNTLEIVEKFLKKYKFIKLIQQKPRGLAAKARNTGFSNAKGEFIALLDHDVEVDRNWLREMVKVISENKKIGIVQSKVYDINKRNTLQNVGLKIYPHTGWVYSMAWGQKDRGQFDSTQNILGGATGVMYRRFAFKKVGGFDEKLGINVDDLDLNWRMWIAGYITVFAPRAVTFHWSKKQKTRDQWIKRTNWEFHYAKIPRIFLKNYSVKNLIYYLPAYFVINTTRGIINILFRFNFAPLLGLIQSTAWNIKILPDTLSERKFIQQKLRVVSDTELFKEIFIQTSLWSIFKNNWLPVRKSGKRLSTEFIKK